MNQQPEALNMNDVKYFFRLVWLGIRQGLFGYKGKP